MAASPASTSSLGLDGRETFHLRELEKVLRPGAETLLEWEKPDGAAGSTRLKVRLDTPMEVTYFRHGGILDYMLRRLIERA